MLAVLCDKHTPVHWATVARCVSWAAARFRHQKSTLAFQRPIRFHQLNLVLRFPKLPMEPEAASGIYGAPGAACHFRALMHRKFKFIILHN